MAKDTTTKQEKAAIAEAQAKKQREARKEAEIASAKAKREAAVKAKAEASKTTEAEAAKAVAETTKTLVPIAKEVNVRFEKAAKLEHDADDHRLAAALRLAEAKKLCEEVKGLSFKAWCEENITTQSYENIRKLATVGAAKDPAAALADLRLTTKKAMAKSRAKKKGATAALDGTRAPAPTPFMQADHALAALDEKAAVALMENRAKKLGLRIVSKTMADFARKAEAEAEKPVTAETLKATFMTLTAGEKLTFLTWAAGEIGAELKMGFEIVESVVTAAVGPDDLSPPPGLRRQPTRRSAPAVE